MRVCAWCQALALPPDVSVSEPLAALLRALLTKDPQHRIGHPNVPEHSHNLDIPHSPY